MPENREGTAEDNPLSREPLGYRPPATMCSECNAIAPNFLIKQERVS